MLKQFDPISKATLAFLKILNIKVNKETVNEILRSHPDYPSILSISDTLYKFYISNGAGRIEKADIDELPVPFMAPLKDKEFPIAVVKEVTDSSVLIYNKNFTKTISLNKETFFKKWDGVYLLAEPDEHAGEQNYQSNKQKAFFNKVAPAVTLILFIVLSVLLLNRNAIGGSFSLSQLIGIHIQYSILVAGVFVTSLLLWYEVDKFNPILNKVCTGISKGNCSLILSSRYGRIFSWLSWSEVGFFYFSGSLLILLFNNNINSSILLISWLNILALPYTIFSIYFQWQVAKQWCVLCLAVQALLILGGFNILAHSFIGTATDISFPFVVQSTLIVLSLILLWYILKSYILQFQENKNVKKEHLRMKLNEDVFDSLLQSQKKLNVPVDGIGIDFGNPNASNTLIKVCNPYCGPCARAHAKIEELLAQTSNLKVKIIFTTSNLDSDISLRPTRHLMAIATLNRDNQSIIKQSLDDWYLADDKNYDLFAEKYPLNGALQEQGNKIEAMDDWCKEMGISFTPTLFFNGYQFPDAYNIHDLQYFLME
jgi:protein-disulfide isomerase